MATWVHRKLENGDIESVLIEAHFVESHIKAGFSFSKKALEQPVEAPIEAPTFSEADTNNSGLLSSNEVRAAAKTADIEGWETKRINTLKKELGYVEED